MISESINIPIQIGGGIRSKERIEQLFSYGIDKVIKETLPIIKNCNIAICNDTGFGHLSAALEIKTIMLIADAPLTYGSYNSKMYPIIPDGEKTVTHGTRGKDKINAIKIYEKILEILN